MPELANVLVFAYAASFSLLFYYLLSHPSKTHGQDGPVIIVGAGIAGARVALELSKQNVSFLILEATDRVGGRMRNFHLGDNSGGLMLEAGANWVQGHRPEDDFSAFIDENIKLKGAGFDWDDIGMIDNGTYVSNEVADPLWERWGAAYTGVYNLMNDSYAANGSITYESSIESALMLFGWQAANEMETAIQRLGVNFEYAAPASQVSIHDLSDIYAPDGPNSRDLFVTDARGFRAVVVETLIQAGVTNTSTSSPLLRLNSPVSSIKYNDSSASVILHNGEVIHGPAVVSTVSLGVLQGSVLNNLNNTEKLLFDPPLPMWKKKAISKFSMNDYHKFFIQFKFPILTSDDPLILLPLKCDEAGFLNIINYNKEDYFENHDLVEVTVTEKTARELICLGEDKALAKTLRYLSAALGQHLSRSDVNAFKYTDFKSDQFFRGSYSSRGPGVVDEDQDDLNKHLGGLFFAGEAHNAKYRGYTQGGWESGKITAAEVLEFIQR